MTPALSVVMIGACVIGFFRCLSRGYEPQPAPVYHKPSPPVPHYREEDETEEVEVVVITRHEHRPHEHARELPRSGKHSTVPPKGGSSIRFS